MTFEVFGGMVLLAAFALGAAIYRIRELKAEIAALKEAERLRAKAASWTAAIPYDEDAENAAWEALRDEEDNERERERLEWERFNEFWNKLPPSGWRHVQRLWGKEFVRDMERDTKNAAWNDWLNSRLPLIDAKRQELGRRGVAQIHRGIFHR